jgi:tetratricopeptide (TPR) repeat protein
MPTRTHSSDPFAPRGSLTREQLLAYAEGKLTPAEAHDVELHLEMDPLLREAAEGLRTPDAFTGYAQLNANRPTNANKLGWWVGAATIAATLVVYVLIVPSEVPPAPLLADVRSAVPAIDATEETMPPLANAEITAAQEQPESLLIGHEVKARHMQPVVQEPAPIVRETIVRVDPKPLATDSTSTPAAARPDSPPRTSRQLIFLHDLKLVHPRELYADDPMMRLADAHVAARFADDEAQQHADDAQINLHYTGFMDEALARFARNDHRGCLDDMRFLLTQYPDDVNALFYAGLCSYNLGLYKRARTFLHRAATHNVDVFDEEATWYHALTLDKLGEQQAAQESFARIAAGGGFYAAAASARTPRAN